MKGADFGRALQGGDDHPVEREEDDDRHEGEEGVNEDEEKDAADFLRFGELVRVFGPVFDREGHAGRVDSLVFGRRLAGGLLLFARWHLEEFLNEIAIVVSHISSGPSSWKP